VKDVHPGDIGRHEIGGELDSPEARVERAGEDANEQRLGGARHSFDECMSTGEKHRQRLVDDLILPDDPLGGDLAKAAERLCNLFSCHHVPRVLSMLAIAAPAASKRSGAGGV
jgi:hypothetical protein